MPLVFGTLKTSKTDFYRSEHQKRKDEMCPFSSLAFLQPTTVDKEPIIRLILVEFLVGALAPGSQLILK